MNKKLCGLLSASMLLAMSGLAYANPCASNVADIQKSVETIKRLDDAGILYSMNYAGDYYSDAVKNVMKNNLHFDVGCSAFMVYSTTGDVLTCRNYDYAHRDKDGKPIGGQLVVKCAPKGGYKSMATVDLFWLDPEKASYVMGALDDGKTDLSVLAVAPYACLDGINEKGLTASILKLEIKPGEEVTEQHDPKKPSAMLSVLMRYMLDQCATVDEAIALAQKYNLTGKAFGMEFHLFLSDATGKCVALEWRHNKMYVVPTDVLTNFYAGFDDAMPSYKNGELREMPVKLEGTDRKYHYGYGHGFHRFTGIVSSIERYINYNTPDHKKIMSEEQAKDILRVASQELNVEETSMTQTSTMFNSQKLSATYWVWQNYDKPYVLDFDF